MLLTINTNSYNISTYAFMKEIVDAFVPPWRDGSGSDLRGTDATPDYATYTFKERNFFVYTFKERFLWYQLKQKAS
jgi:hypothetical protein